MKKTFSPVVALSSLFLMGAFFIASETTGAQQQPSDAPPQPKASPADEEPPAVTNLGKADVKQTMQTVQTGEQTEVKVTNGVGTYIVKPNERVGTSLPGDGQSNTNNPVQWVIKSWGGDKSTTKDDPAPPTLKPNPDAPESK
jgi:hypothetical protein